MIDIEKEELVSYRVNKRCSKCNTGNLIFDGFTKTSNPPWYVHRCNNCGNLEDLRKQYPCIEHESTGKFKYC